MTATVLGLSACTQTDPGVAQASPGTEQPTGTSTPPKTTSKPKSPLTDIEPCSLLDASALANLGLGPGKSENVAGARGCKWDTADRDITSVGFWDRLGIGPGQIASDTPVIDAPIGRHEGRRSDSGLTCTFSIGVTETSRVDVTGTADDMESSCKLAKPVAEAIEPKLP